MRARPRQPADLISASLGVNNDVVANLAVRRALDALDKATIAIAGAALVCMALAQGWQVFARYVLNDSPSWTEPLALLFMSTRTASTSSCSC